MPSSERFERPAAATTTPPVAATRSRPATRLVTILVKLAATIAGLAVFILALELLKKGAAGVAPVLHGLRVDGVWDSLGLGWLMAYLVLSGSPVAAITLTLFSGNAITDLQAFAMITGSRLGASFIVLFIGFLYFLRGHQRVASISIGVLSLLVTATIYLPAMAVGYYFLNSGIFDGIQFGRPGSLNSVIDVVYDPMVLWITTRSPLWLVFIGGIGTLLLAFQLFDKALPEVKPETTGFERIADFVYRPPVMLLLGLAVTCITLSVSVSLSVLVPLSAKGYIRRENLIPYIMGANISTFIDTLFAALLLDTPRAFTVVMTEMVSVALLSLLILAFIYQPYQRGIDAALALVVKDHRSLAIFIALITFIPVALLFS
jgi:solute carrier family 34 (sodium-dependent phosphate cotransporter)